MLDLGLSKLAMIGVVALVVIGPERLPRVARTVGTLMGRAQRYVNDIKAEVSREIELDELKRARSSFEQAAQNVHSTIHDNLRQHETELNDAWASGTGSSDSAGHGAHVEPDITGVSAPSPYEMSGSRGAGVPWRPGGPSSRRKSWRSKQATPPTWFKRVSVTRTHIQSGAARVARHRPASLRRPSRFF